MNIEKELENIELNAIAIQKLLGEISNRSDEINKSLKILVYHDQQRIIESIKSTQDVVNFFKRQEKC